MSTHRIQLTCLDKIMSGCTVLLISRAIIWLKPPEPAIAILIMSVTISLSIIIMYIYSKETSSVQQDSKLQYLLKVSETEDQQSCSEKGQLAMKIGNVLGRLMSPRSFFDIIGQNDDSSGLLCNFP